MSALAGTRPLLALALKRERVRIPVYVVLFVLLVVQTAVQSRRTSRRPPRGPRTSTPSRATPA